MILLGVSGSIAAYKAVELLRALLKAGQEVHVIMTQAATHFVGPLTFQALSGHPVLTDTLDPQGWQMAHLDLPEKASAFVLPRCMKRCGCTRPRRPTRRRSSATAINSSARNTACLEGSAIRA